MYLQKILLSPFMLSAIERSYSSFAPLTKYFDLLFASSYLPQPGNC
jgi:hypothetical protein